MTELSLSQPLLKRCSKCGNDYPATPEYFSKMSASKDGLKVWCRSCVSEYNKAYRATHLEELREYNRQFRATPEAKARKRELASTPEYREWANQYMAQYRAIPEKKRHFQEYMQEWGKNNPDRITASSHRRRARKQNNGGDYTRNDIRVQFKTQKGRCWWCQDELVEGNTHIDHRIPISRGGSNAPENLCLSCKHCNLSKGSKLPHEWTGRLL